MAKKIDGIYRHGKISGLHTNPEELIVYHVNYIGTNIYEELLLEEAVVANQYSNFRIHQGEIEDKFSYVNVSTSIT